MTTIQPEDWRDVSALFDEFGCATHKLSIRGMVIRFSEHGKRELGHHNYFRRVDDPKGRRWSTEAAALKAVV